MRAPAEQRDESQLQSRLSNCTASILDAGWRRMLTNVLGGPLRPCCTDPATGFYRDGYCRTSAEDIGQHTVCARMTREFLEFSRLRGNDLATPVPEFGFLGVGEGDHWCLCVQRWTEALRAGCAPPVVLEACHISALEFVDLEALKAHAVPAPFDAEE